MIIALDFDGTCVTHAYPKIGEDIGAKPFLHKLCARGDRLILWTMRDGRELAEAVAWFEKAQIPLFGINSNPEQREWTGSPKAYAQLYIDDAALGAPLLHPTDSLGTARELLGIKERPYLDWEKASRLLGIEDEATSSISSPSDALHP